MIILIRYLAYLNTLAFTSLTFANTEYPDFLSMSLEELMNVEITGSTLTPTNLKDVPSSVTVFTQQEIQHMAVSSLMELSNFVPGFQSFRTTQYPSQNTFSSRGRKEGANTADVLVLLDGQRLDSSQNGGHAVLFAKFPVSIIERVEFIRGPGSSIYGSNAMSGVINIITRSETNEINVGYGSFSHKETDILGTKKVGDATLDWFIHYEKDDGDEYLVDDTAGPDNITTHDPQSMLDFNLKINLKDTFINLHHYSFEANELYSLGLIDNSNNKSDNTFSSLSIKHEFEWSSIDSWFWLGFHTTDWEVTGLAPVSTTFSFNDYDELKFQWHNHFTINNNQQMQFGFEYRNLEAPEALRNNIITIQSAFEQRIMGAYMQYQNNSLENYHITLGLRFDDVEDTDSKWSPRIGVVREFNETHSLKLLYSEAFRAPASVEKDLVNNPAILGNPNLTAETLQTWELIWIAQWKEAMFNLGYFNTKFDNSIIRVPIGGGILEYQNSTEEPVRGIEFEASYQANNFWLMRASFTHFTEKPESSFRETDTITSFIINFNKQKWNVNVSATYSGEREFLSTSLAQTTIDDYWLFYSKISYNYKKDWEIYFQARNLLNEEYTTPPVGSTIDTGIINRGSEILIGGNLSF